MYYSFLQELEIFWNFVENIVQLCEEGLESYTKMQIVLYLQFRSLH